MRLRIAMIGTRGVPARYGGFETAIEEIGRRLVERGHHVTVYCRGHESTQQDYLGMRLVHLPSLRHKITETLSHTALSVLHSDARKAQAAIVFNAANAPLLPVLRAAGVPTAVHVDGLEWQRSKWSGAGRRYYLINERLSVRWADRLIADAIGIQDYYRSKYDADSIYIPYGAPIQTAPALQRLAEMGLQERRYHLVVARFEPENHVHLALEAYAKTAAAYPLVVVGSAPYAEAYVMELRRRASRHEKISLVGPLWDQELLDALYAGAVTYIHGHSVGGTNPSLLRAMGAAAAVLAFDVKFNREVLGVHGRFWRDSSDLAQLVVEAERHPNLFKRAGVAAQAHAAKHYTWDAVASAYESLCVQLHAGAQRR